MSIFTGFQPEAIQFLADLAENNDRAWFQPRKAEFERLLKEPMEAMIAALADRLAARGVPLARRPEALAVPDLPRHPLQQGQVAVQDAPRRDLPVGRRSGGDGRPVGRTRSATHGNGGYFHFQPGEMYVGGGMWQMEKPPLDAFRPVVRDDPEPGAGGARGRPRSSPGSVAPEPHEQLKRVPPGFPKDHPLAHMFRWKDVVFGRRLSDEEVLSPDLPDRLAASYAKAASVYRFLDAL